MIFHYKASQRKIRNYIAKLKDVDGMWEEDENLQNFVVSYFLDSFTSSNPSNMDRVLDTLQPKVTPQMNEGGG